MQTLVTPINNVLGGKQEAVKFSSGPSIHEAFGITVPNHWAGRQDELNDAISRLYAPEKAQPPMTELGANPRARR